MIDTSFKSFGVFCFSILCFGLGTLIVGVLFSCGYSGYVFPIAWLVGTIVFGIIMMFEHGDVEEEKDNATN